MQPSVFTEGFSLYHINTIHSISHFLTVYLTVLPLRYTLVPSEKMMHHG
ncbi:hypothetical protein UUU_31480 [Klebsiella pneumoniae subsp. pneumoniae DSM 30104 = JCM 1662 = NBRC 14940]|nr:hypothetical protein UUU_31480 [Klebsiella pneumoniae subsp. pneumoniae DSM 30104 = JCM 1662 = NBRC 14940]